MTSALPRVAMPDTVRDLGPVPVEPLVEFVGRFGEGFWEAEDAEKENAFEVFHSTQHVIMRFLADPADPRSWYELPIWSVLEPTVAPVVDAAIRPYGFVAPTICKAMFARLRAGSGVDRHRDSALGNRLCHKIHVPLVSHPDCRFEVAGAWFHLAVGHAYEVNNVRPHAADNRSTVDRVHLVFEVFDDR